MLKNNHTPHKSKISAKQRASTRKAPSGQHNPQAILQRAQTAPSSLTPQDIIQLQRTIGNRAVQRLLTQSRPERPAPRLSPTQRTQPVSPIKHQASPEKGKGRGDHVQRLPWWLGGKRKKKKPERINWIIENWDNNSEANVEPAHGLEGDDPVTVGNITDQAHSKDLLYGLAWHRAQTHGRMTEEDGRIRTIDTYNNEVGIKGELLTQTSAIPMLYKVRQALHQPSQWKRHLPASKHAYPNGQRINNYIHNNGDLTDIEKWMTFLVRNRRKIGLMDLGDSDVADGGRPKGLNKIESKKRWEKNKGEKQNYDNLSPATVHQMLSFGLNENRVAREYDNLSYTNKIAANKWVMNAFWRRTSKLGIDFTLSPHGLNSDIHFNLASGKKVNMNKWDPVHWGIRNDVAEDEGPRKITESEYRHAQKLINENPDLEDRIHFYSEY